MNAADIIAAEAKYLVGTYVRPEVVFTHGQGAYLYDSEGRQYLDFNAGIAVAALGHADPEWAAAVSDQAGRLTHVSNLYHTAPHVELARRLVENSFADRVFFANSGSEANETALKFARKVAWQRAGEQPHRKTKIVAFNQSFHGRTMGVLSTTYKPHYREPFMPLVGDVAFARFNDVDSAHAAIDADTCAVLVEPIQGEGGIHPATPEFLRALRAICDEQQALLIFDEVQCGLGRSGRLWAYEHYGVMPDIMALAKPLAGGLPIGAALVTQEVAAAIQPGDHGSTFGAGPLACRAACVVFDRVSGPEFLAEVREKGAYLKHLLNGLEAEEIAEIRGEGLMVGVEFKVPVAPLIAAAREQGVLLISAGTDTIRLCPPLIVSREQIKAAVDAIGASLDALA